MESKPPAKKIIPGGVTFEAISDSYIVGVWVLYARGAPAPLKESRNESRGSNRKMENTT
jgi:hypothetical protein